MLPILIALAAASPQAAVVIRPDAIPWEAAAPDGSRFALLEGVRDRAGEAFSYAFALPPGLWDRPHSHSSTARIFVLKGTLKLGWGRAMDKAQAQTFPAGSFVVVPAGAVHYDGADEETIILGVASGVWATRYEDGGAGSAGTPISPAHGGQPAVPSPAHHR
ncbi:cupin domain-containing protein [Sandarakinorhabdus rubra]|uniref:cupin domain-containing protein n=1 Tax=Sandarakinorhabdus rubra TaxID=2672568 RepID=UPI0013DA659B|nr:cupin domain-containing protein [Sandarakinorhabdus rubra]